jgi:hypothetical protein
MGPWLETVGVVLLAAGAGGLGYALGRLRGRWWLAGYDTALVLTWAAVAARWSSELSFADPIAWIALGRREFVLLAASCPLLLGTAAGRLRRPRLKALLGLLGAFAVLNLSVWPFLVSSLCYDELRGLKTRVLRNGVCMQSTEYTCGAAAAVTALGMLGLEADESELAIASRTRRTVGVSSDMLCVALNSLYGPRGLRCQYRQMDSPDELRDAPAAIVYVRHREVIGHAAALMEMTDERVVLGDPLGGQRVLSQEEFADIWLGDAILLWREPAAGR